jgi:bifunctional oligoribonuclease and PAP phosphatase NrnA
MTNTASILALLQLIDERHSFLVTSHARPDGDAIGSSLGLMHLLEALGKEVVVAFADSVPSAYNCLPGVERIACELPTASPDAAILLECDAIERTSFNRRQFDAMRPRLVLNIDHHLSGRAFADFNWIDPDACAVGTMIYDLAIASGVTITPAMADCLYTAVLTDTGGFVYALTNAAAHHIAAHLMECGADAHKIAQSIYFSNPLGKIRLLGVALSNLTIDIRGASHDAGNIAWSFITLADMESAGATVEDCEGVVNHLIGIAGIQAAAFLREIPPSGMSSQPQFRLSLRSKGDIDVATVAECFGGGGHRNASGCTLNGPLSRAAQRIVTKLLEQTAVLAVGTKR